MVGRFHGMDRARPVCIRPQQPRPHPGCRITRATQHRWRCEFRVRSGSARLIRRDQARHHTQWQCRLRHLRRSRIPHHRLRPDMAGSVHGIARRPLGLCQQSANQPSGSEHPVCKPRPCRSVQDDQRWSELESHHNARGRGPAGHQSEQCLAIAGLIRACSHIAAVDRRWRNLVDRGVRVLQRCRIRPAGRQPRDRVRQLRSSSVRQHRCGWGLDPGGLRAVGADQCGFDQFHHGRHAGDRYV